LELAALALSTETIMTTVPGSANAVAILQMGHALAELDDITYNLVTRDTGKDIAHVTAGRRKVGKAHTTCEHLNKHLVSRGMLELEVAEGEGNIGLVEDDSFVIFGK
jgi:hypothetical protein